MNELTRDVMDQVYTGYSTKYNSGLGTAPNKHKKFCEIVTSSAPIEEYPMTSLQGALRKWVGSRIVNRLTGKKVQIINDTYEYTLGIPANDIMFDKMGLHNGRFVDIGIMTARHPDKLAFDVLLTNPKWADNKNFFVADRKIDNNNRITINNLVAAVFSYDAYSTAKKQMMAFTDASGEPLELEPTLLIVGPKHEETARAMLNNDTIIIGGVAVSNPYRNSSIELMMSGRFIGDYEDDFRLICGNRGIKPVIVQKVYDAGLIRKDRFNDDNMFIDDEALYGVKVIDAAGPGIPQLVVAGIPA